ncbi:FUSC family protein [Microbacterium oryzae]|uniref:FUSC family protein n=1 Tax=Microbacterium oryzae TaxID=743009 RepID=UPI0025B1B972|nr:FUSC family protein [Microbacterium oryzae]MDN3309731.1 FUSC family protein [Microbacterium oryzae]
MRRGQELDGPGRVLLAVKVALACGLALHFAPYVPFAADEYSYYAPLGALVSMYPTLMRSVRTGLQTLVGVGLGILLGTGGLALVYAGGPALLALALVVGLGVLVGAFRWLGAGRDWIAMAGMFVLLIGGGDPDEFSVSYLVTLAFGVIVGVAVNLLIVPPLHLTYAGRRLSQLRDAAARSLHDLADLIERGDGPQEEIDGIVTSLRRTASAVSDDVLDADESARGNPRSRRHREERRTNDRRRRALERTVFAIRSLSDALFRDTPSEEGEPTAPEPTQRTLVSAIRACADLVATPLHDEQTEDLANAAQEALDQYLAEVRESGAADADAVTVGFCLRRVIDSARSVDA